MIIKESLSVSEYQPRVKLARPASTFLVSAADQAEAVDKASVAQSTETRVVALKALEKALGNLSAHVQNLQRSLQFSVDTESGETVVRVVDTKTQEVIRQIPSEELLVIAERLRSRAGLLLSEQI